MKDELRKLLWLSDEGKTSIKTQAGRALHCKRAVIAVTVNISTEHLGHRWLGEQVGRASICAPLVRQMSP